MGIMEIVADKILLHANIILYGNAASEALALAVANDINEQWNRPRAVVKIKKNIFLFSVKAVGIFAPDLKPEEIFENDNPRNNYFRVEEKAAGNISHVDGLGSNTGYFQLDNILNNNTTAAHEFGHTLGLAHPTDLDIRHKESPGIMYPRGSLVRPQFQYDPTVTPGTIGGTMNPIHRLVTQEDIDDLKIGQLDFNNRYEAVIGAFTSVWHEEESQI